MGSGASHTAAERHSPYLHQDLQKHQQLQELQNSFAPGRTVFGGGMVSGFTVSQQQQQQQQQLDDQHQHLQLSSQQQQQQQQQQQLNDQHRHLQLISQQQQQQQQQQSEKLQMKTLRPLQEVLRVRTVKWGSNTQPQPPTQQQPQPHLPQSPHLQPPQGE